MRPTAVNNVISVDLSSSEEGRVEIAGGIQLVQPTEERSLGEGEDSLEVDR